MDTADGMFHFWLEGICPFDFVAEGDEVVDLHLTLAAAGDQFPALEETQSGDCTLMFISIVDDVCCVCAPHCDCSIGQTASKVLLIRKGEGCD